MPISRFDLVNADKLLKHVLSDLKEFQAANDTVGPRLIDVLDAYLKWHGIMGYTAQILNIVEATTEIKNAS